MRGLVPLLAVGALIASVALALSRDDDAARAAVRRAAAQTTDVGSMRFTITDRAPEVPADLASEIDGVMDYVHHRGRMSWGGELDQIIDGDTTYMRLPMPWREDPRWLRNTTSNELDVLDVQERAMRDPLGLLEFLTGASSDVTTVGHEFVRGVQATHYEGTLDLQKVVDRAPPDKRAALQDWLDFIAQHESTKVRYGLWVDANGIARRLRIDNSEGLTTTIEYYDFGVPVDVTPPPEEEIITFDQFFDEIQHHEGCAASPSDRDSRSDGSRSITWWDGSGSASSGVDVGQSTSTGSGGITVVTCAGASATISR